MNQRVSWLFCLLFVANGACNDGEDAGWCDNDADSDDHESSVVENVDDDHDDDDD